MSKFLTPVNLQVLRGQFRGGRQLFKLLNDVLYQSDILGGILVVKAGFITDLASVPRIPLIFDLAGGLADEPAVLHDWLYTTHSFNGKPITRPTADAVLREAIAVSDGKHAPGWLMWLGVRVGGQSSWDADAPPQPAHIAALLPNQQGQSCST